MVRTFSIRQALADAARLFTQHATLCFGLAAFLSCIICLKQVVFGMNLPFASILLGTFFPFLIRSLSEIMFYSPLYTYVAKLYACAFADMMLVWYMAYVICLCVLRMYNQQSVRIYDLIPSLSTLRHMLVMTSVIACFFVAYGIMSNLYQIGFIISLIVAFVAIAVCFDFYIIRAVFMFFVIAQADGKVSDPFKRSALMMRGNGFKIASIIFLGIGIPAALVILSNALQFDAKNLSGFPVWGVITIAVAALPLYIVQIFNVDPIGVLVGYFQWEALSAATLVASAAYAFVISVLAIFTVLALGHAYKQLNTPEEIINPSAFVN